MLMLSFVWLSVSPHARRGCVRWVEGLWIGPDRAKARLYLRIQEIVHRQAVGLPIGEVGIVAPLTAEIGIDLNHVADVGDYQERWVCMIVGKSAGIVLGLFLGRDHYLVPAFCAALGVTKLLRRLYADQFKLLGLASLFALGRLLRFKDEAIALVAIDSAGRSGPSGMSKRHGAFKHVVAGERLFFLKVWCGEAQRCRQSLNEKLSVSHLGTTGSFDLGYQPFDFGQIYIPHAR